jgi:hypothetical protein
MHYVAAIVNFFGCKQTSETPPTMRQERKAKVREKHDAAGELSSCSKFSSDDYAVYPHRDNVKLDAIDFALGDYGGSGVFSEDKVLSLAERHKLSREQSRELSRLIGYSLDVDSQTSFITISQSKAKRRMADRNKGKSHRNIELNADDANALFASLGLKVAVMENADQAQDDTLREVNDTDGNMQFVTLEEARRILQPDNLRKERDNRRLLVVESCCYVALDAGWRLTYTTDSTRLKNQRGGRLINLIQDVIEMVTNGRRDISVHTIKKDIETVRRRFEKRGDLRVLRVKK